MSRTRRAAARLGLLRYSMVHFLAALSLLVVAAPFLEESPAGKVLESVILTLVLLSAVLAVGGRAKTLHVAGVLVAPVLLFKWLNHLRSDTVPLELTTAAGLLFTVFVTWRLLRYILVAPQVNLEVLCGGVASYLMLGLVWAFVYILVAALAPGSFTFSGGPGADQNMRGFNALYFSFTTLNTGGFGDITPASGPARMLAMAEQMIGMFYVVILIARLVALHSTPPPTTG